MEINKQIRSYSGAMGCGQKSCFNQNDTIQRRYLVQPNIRPNKQKLLFHEINLFHKSLLNKFQEGINRIQNVIHEIPYLNGQSTV